MNKKLKNPILLVIAAAIWGFAFSFQSVGMEYVEPFTFICIRNLIGTLALLPVVFFFDARKKMTQHKNSNKVAEKEDYKRLLLGGVCCGTVLFISSGAQQFGMQYTTVGKAGFITALYIVIVPLIGVFMGKKNRWTIWLSIFIAVIGFYFLTMIGESSFTKGDAYVLVCAFTFAGHILCVDYFAPQVDCVKMSCIQFIICGTWSGIVMFLTESPSLERIMQAMGALLYTGVLSSGVAYTFQIVGQKDYNPAIAALLMSLESVFSVLGGWFILKQSLSYTEAIGCVLIFAGIILAQIPEEWMKKKEKPKLNP